MRRLACIAIVTSAIVNVPCSSARIYLIPRKFPDERRSFAKTGSGQTQSKLSKKARRGGRLHWTHPEYKQLVGKVAVQHTERSRARRHHRVNIRCCGLARLPCRIFGPADDREKDCSKTVLFQSFPCVCPEPVLVKSAFYIQMAENVALFCAMFILLCVSH